jgi:ankyrin repeat protein
MISRLRMRLRGGAALAIALVSGAAVTPGNEDLLNAAARGDVAAVQSLLVAGVDPNAARGDGLTALHMAARAGNLELTNLLLKGGASVSAATRIGGYTPLHLASEVAQASTAAALLSAGAEPDVRTTGSGVTPLHLAAKAPKGESVIQVLLEHGAQVDAMEASAGQTPLMFAASYGRTAAVRELLRAGADHAKRTRVVDVLQSMAIDRQARARFLEAMQEIRKTSPDGIERDLTAAEVQAAIAAQREFLRSEEAIQDLLQDFHPDDLARPRIYTRTDVEYLQRPLWETKVGVTGGMTALIHAAREGHIDVIKALLDGGADIDQASGDGSTALVSALQNGRFDAGMLLIDQGADPNLATHTDGVAALFAVLQTRWANETSHPQPRAHELQTVEYLDVLEALLVAGADPNMRITQHPYYWEYDFRLGNDINGATPFFRAAWALDLEALKMLAEYGADPNIPTVWAEVGLRQGRQEDGRTVDDSGLPPLPEGTANMYPIHAAAGGGHLGYEALDMNQIPDNFLKVVRYLVEEHGANVSLPNGWGYTPLHYAAVRGDNDMIGYLVSKGADLHATSRLGQSTVDMARGGGAGFHPRSPQPETVEYMLGLGAEFKCIDTHFAGTGAYCAGSGAAPFEGALPSGEGDAGSNAPPGGR